MLLPTSNIAAGPIPTAPARLRSPQAEPPSSPSRPRSPAAGTAAMHSRPLTRAEIRECYSPTEIPPGTREAVTTTSGWWPCARS